MLRPRHGLSGQSRTARTSIRRRSAYEFPWLVEKTAGAPQGRVAAAGPKKVIPATGGAEPTLQRSEKPGALFACLPKAEVATLPHQGYSARPRGLGGEMGEVLAKENRWPAGASALLDRSPQRLDQRGEILRL